MSRGLGSFQRRMISVLLLAEDHELSMPELRRRLGDPDPALVRRAVRSMERRSLAERRYELDDEGRRFRIVRYTWWHQLMKALRDPEGSRSLEDPLEAAIARPRFSDEDLKGAMEYLREQRPVSLEELEREEAKLAEWERLREDMEAEDPEDEDDEERAVVNRVNVGFLLREGFRSGLEAGSDRNV